MTDAELSELLSGQCRCDPGMTCMFCESADRIEALIAENADLKTDNSRLEQLQRANEGRIKEIVSDELLRRAESAEAERDALVNGVRIKIPTDTMEQEIAARCRIATSALRAEVDALKHDIERHIQIAADLATK